MPKIFLTVLMLTFCANAKAQFLQSLDGDVYLNYIAISDVAECRQTGNGHFYLKQDVCESEKGQNCLAFDVETRCEYLEIATNAGGEPFLRINAALKSAFESKVAAAIMAEKQKEEAITAAKERVKNFEPKGTTILQLRGELRAFSEDVKLITE